MRFRVRAILIWWWNELELDEWFDFVRYAFSHMHKRQQSREVQKNQKEVIIKTAKKKSWNGHERNWRISSSAFSSFTFMLESCLGESESNRHHPAVKHNYTLLLFLVYFYFICNFSEIWWINAIFSFPSLYRQTKSRRVKVTLTRFWSQRSPQKKEGKCFVNQEKFARDEVNGRSLSMQLNSNNFRVVVKIENGLLEQRFSIKKRLRRLMICTCVAPGSCRKLNTQLRSV